MLLFGSKLTENPEYKTAGKNHDIQPRTYYEELAELGLLNELIKTRFKFDFNNDENFRTKMLDILYKKSSVAVPEIEKINLSAVCEALSYFMEYNKEYLTDMDYRQYMENGDSY